MCNIHLDYQNKADTNIPAVLALKTSSRRSTNTTKHRVKKHFHHFHTRYLFKGVCVTKTTTRLYAAGLLFDISRSQKDIL